MRVSTAILTLGMLTISSPPPAAFGQATEDERAAQAVADAWLDLIDDQEYAESWNEAAPAFQEAVTVEQWTEQAGTVRQQVGAVQEREFEAAESSTDPPNAPAGEYVLITYKSAFANLPSATETVATMKQEDGSWKVAGYFVQPA